MNSLYHGDCLDILPSLGRVNCLFADPPDNIGLGYGSYKDKLTDDQYLKQFQKWINMFVDVADIVWLSFNAKWTFEVGRIVADLVDHSGIEAKPCVQVFTFGQHRKTDLGNGHRPLWRLRWPTAPIYPEQVKVRSWRQEHGDKRAAPGGCVPLDVFDFTRVTGNSKQRRKWHPTQLNEELVERCLKLATKEGDSVCDPFAGTGTTLRVCRRINRRCATMDVDRTYCARISEENNLPISVLSKGNA